ncbi:MAG TPA: peptide chain release factor N(5)-glutamine methyltransferase [Sphingomicrobium sp.]|nr:peptide chain release factor N(5)-glutamine methyltransferase [Sphingomicrobium sp.]
MKPVARALADATRRLETISDTHRLDAELLMAAALEIERDTLLLNPPAGPVPANFAAMLERRLAGEPVAYITGKRAFWNIELMVGPGALVPRPDSEVLIVAALDHFGSLSPPKRILDLGTGPGTLLLAALDLWPGATGVGIDSSVQALDYAKANAKRLGLVPRAHFKRGNWAVGITEQFDLILCNPPYVADDAELGPGVAEYEPHEALFAGGAGLDEIRALAPQLPPLLPRHGLAMVEIGHDQGESATAILSAAGLVTTLKHDLAGLPRAIALTWA